MDNPSDSYIILNKPFADFTRTISLLQVSRGVFYYGFTGSELYYPRILRKNPEIKIPHTVQVIYKNTYIQSSMFKRTLYNQFSTIKESYTPQDVSSKDNPRL